MPRKNRTNRSRREGKRNSAPRRRHGVPRQRMDDMPQDLSYDVTATSAGDEQAGDNLAGDNLAGDGRAGDGRAGDERTGSGRILGIDFGERRIGLALSDPSGLIAHGLDTMVVKNADGSLDAIVSIAETKQAIEIVLGLPVNMDGTTGEMAEKVEAFADRLRGRVSCEVRTWDERLTSVSAQRAMNEMGMEIRGNKESQDRIAATLLLQSYLDSRR